MSSPEFPLELEREVFEIMALLYPGTIPTLLHVARRVLVWIEPCLYSVVSLNNSPRSSDMAHALLRATTTKPPSFFHNVVRHLLLEWRTPWSSEETISVLKLCTGIVNLAISPFYTYPTGILAQLAQMQLQRLAVGFRALFGPKKAIDMRHPLFSSITHLDIFDTLDGDTDMCAQVPAIPALTHLCVHGRVPWETITMLLAACPRLELLVNRWLSTTNAHAQAKNVPFHDMRFVIQLYKNYWSEWEANARGLGPNFWSLADDFVARKRSGDIDAKVYLSDSEGNPVQHG
ncbi:hypothetical protein C8R44DRAFT_812439 [Mycena epipterygia]|nr:hypothetical protein C8R44DRAFT_812439 [Mycena epipterygia]